MGSSVVTVTGPFVTEVHEKGLRAPVRLNGADTRGWQVARRGADLLYLDELGSLWWARANGRFDATVIRACWPEEGVKFAATIRTSVEQILAA